MSINSQCITLKAENFVNEVLESSLLVIVYFFVPWCGFCKIMDRTVEGISNDVPNIVKLCKLNVDDYEILATQYEIKSTPTLVFFRNGRIIERLVSLNSKETIINKIHTLI